MIDPVQVLFIVAITVATILFTVVAVEVIQLLRQGQKTISRVNQILQEVELLTGSVSGSVEKATTFVKSMQHGVKLVEFLQKFVDKGGHKKKEEE